MSTANACTTVLSYRYIFQQSPPEDIGDATFYGEIEIKKIKNDDTVIGVLKASETHPHQVGKKLKLVYLPTSCGPWVNKGDRGLVIGNAIEKDNTLYVMPQTTTHDFRGF